MLNTETLNRDEAHLVMLCYDHEESDKFRFRLGKDVVKCSKQSSEVVEIV